MSVNTMRDAHEILEFWFHQTPPERWFRSDEGFVTAFLRFIRQPCAVSWPSGGRASPAGWRKSSCSISFHAICFAIAPFHSRLTVWRWSWHRNWSNNLTLTSFLLKDAILPCCHLCIRNRQSFMILRSRSISATRAHVHSEQKPSTSG